MKCASYRCATSCEGSMFFRFSWSIIVFFSTLYFLTLASTWSTCIFRYTCPSKRISCQSNAVEDLWTHHWCCQQSGKLRRSRQNCKAMRKLWPLGIECVENACCRLWQSALSIFIIPYRILTSHLASRPNMLHIFRPFHDRWASIMFLYIRLIWHVMSNVWIFSWCSKWSEPMACTLITAYEL